MSIKKNKLILVSVLLLIANYCISQDSSSVTNSTKNKIRNIPHETIWEKWMWTHRTFAYVITKERAVKYDTTYIKSNYKRLVITVPFSTRFLQFTLSDAKSGNRLTFAPNLQYNVGVSISSKWASFIINSGLKVFNEDVDTKGETKYQDYQLNLYGRKFTTDMFVQHYISDKNYAIRSDVNSLHMGVSTYYILNNKRFSYGSSFAFVEQQKKSAGSLLLGVYYSYFDAAGNPSLISAPFRDSFDTLSLIKSGYTHDFGINLGYIYTLVFLKKCSATLSLVQGIGGEQMRYEREDHSTYNQITGGAGKLHARVALRYDNGRYFIGAMGMYDYFLFSSNSNSSFDYSFGKFMMCVGYRFSILKTEKKILRKLKLIDY
jgi:hypothetical protein